MAERTRNQATLHDLSKRVDKIEEGQARMEAQISKFSDVLAEQSQKLAEFMEAFKAQKEGSSMTQVEDASSGKAPSTPMVDQNQIAPPRVVNVGGAGASNAQGLSTRLSKVDFPRFDGTRVRDWLYRCEQFFSIDQTAPEMKVKLAAVHLEGKAIQWHQNYMKLKFQIYPPWSDYMVDISARFGELFDDPMADLVSLQHTTTIEAYLDEFEGVLCKLSLPTEHILSIFMAGLKPHVKCHVRQSNPKHYHEAANVARLYEAERKAMFKPQSKSYPPLLPTPATATKPTPNPSLPQPPDKPWKSVSQEEMQERRARGMCMFCYETYTPGHHLKHKRAQLYMMEEVEADEPTTRLLTNTNTYNKPRTSCNHLGALCPDLFHIPPLDSSCLRCDHTADIWLCLCCKDVYCSRYVNKHMLEHYEQKGHCVALSYSVLSVWCSNCNAYLDAAVMDQLRPVYETAYILKFGEAPPVRAAQVLQLGGNRSASKS